MARLTAALPLSAAEVAAEEAEAVLELLEDPEVGDEAAALLLLAEA